MPLLHLYFGVGNPQILIQKKTKRKEVIKIDALKATKKYRKQEEYERIKEAFEAKEKALKEKLEGMTEEERIAYYQQEKAKQSNIVQTLAVASTIAKMSGNNY